MNLSDLFKASGLGVIVGIIVQQLFAWLSERRQHRADMEKLQTTNDAELTKLKAQHLNDLNKHYFDSRLDAAAKITATLILTSEAGKEVAFVARRASAGVDIDIQDCTQLATRLAQRAPEHKEVLVALALLELLFPNAANIQFSRAVLNTMRHYQLAVNSINVLLQNMAAFQAKRNFVSAAERASTEAALEQYRNEVESIDASAKHYEANTFEIIENIRASLVPS